MGLYLELLFVLGTAFQSFSVGSQKLTNRKGVVTPIQCLRTLKES